MTEPSRLVTIGIELRVTTGQLDDDMAALSEIRERFAKVADLLMREGPGARAVSLFWAVDHAGTIERYELEEEP